MLRLTVIHGSTSNMISAAKEYKAPAIVAIRGVMVALFCFRAEYSGFQFPMLPTDTIAESWSSSVADIPPRQRSRGPARLMAFFPYSDNVRSPQ